jgi:hypothetical protein
MSEPEKDDNLTKVYGGACGAFLGLLFYVADCSLVYLHGNHRDISFFKAGIYEGGPLGFLASAVVVICGLGYFAYFGLRYILGERS